MRPLLLISTSFLLLCFQATSQTADSILTPEVTVTVSLPKDTFKLGEDVQVNITLRNTTVRPQSIWFDKPKISTGGPAWTTVALTDRRTGKSVLKYANKALLSSQAYSTQQVKAFLYPLKPGQSVSGLFSLYDLVVTNTENYKLDKGTYTMQIFYATNSSNIISFTVD